MTYSLKDFTKHFCKPEDQERDVKTNTFYEHMHLLVYVGVQLGEDRIIHPHLPRLHLTPSRFEIIILGLTR